MSRLAPRTALLLLLIVLSVPLRASEFSDDLSRALQRVADFSL